MEGDASAFMHAKGGWTEPAAASVGEPVSRPGDVDKQVARRIRAARLQRGLSQNELAQAMNLSLQQVHKYETARNRIGAARLAQVAEVLDIGVDSLFDDPTRGHARAENGSSRECLELVRNFQRVADRNQRSAFLALLRAAAAGESGGTADEDG
ncbi:Helix-turn-helix [Limimonas halophila]|uniref:Helix-turn-helix n=1 Tax=Limimonas halophila TaxID=1082479 RepID=A0A1G7RWT3_9PROT|nr:helix-turn-helix transcriptional regulator [Limimonas halophila]SDG15218.1 Helix-turn-helix [Limimonas halophila]